ncbi:EAL domain-containing protein [Aeromonas veronii]|uniref:EAL domain-containing protein n=1 Tax=Aeromonas veronii TaxID=654 RepID=UPI0005C174E8|nr:EAL domain-containing protein [Aeromonas veronii]
MTQVFERCYQNINTPNINIDENINISLRLQPIFSFNENTVSAYEMLSRVHGYKRCAEDFFKEISCEQLTKLLKHQILQVNSYAVSGRIFINVKISCLSLEFIEWLSIYNEKPLAFELDYQDLQAENLNHEDFECINQNLKIIQKAGHQLWLDDFDGLFSQRAQYLLSRVSWDGIKLDKSVLWCLCSKEISEFNRIIDLCTTFAPQTVVEGIESDYQFDVTKESKAKFGQGFYWEDIHM